MQIRYFLFGSSLLLSAVGASALSGQEANQPPADRPSAQWPVRAVRATGQSVTPAFEGWFRNPDGTYSLSFGYYSRNSEETVDIPLGPNNFIEPAIYDGKQPTHFLPQPKDRGPGRGLRYWSVFTVQVPADFGDQRVVWTLRHRGETFSIPAHMRNPNYEMDALRVDASGSTPPIMKFAASGPEGAGPNGVTVGPLRASVGRPLDVSLWVTEAKHPPVTLEWFKHQGPGAVTFAAGKFEVTAADGRASTTATFSEPGEYVLRIMATNRDTEFDRYCCWTNGFVRVSVAP